jgi:hypothetical protein
MQIALILVLLLGGVAAFLMFRQPVQKKPATKARPASTPPPSRYSSVSIMLPQNCCSSAQSLAGARFLTKEAPQLPLANCNTTPCKCGFIRHEDRREEDEDRRAIHGLRAELHALHTGEERRQRRGRRSYDLAMA